MIKKIYGSNLEMPKGKIFICCIRKSVLSKSERLNPINILQQEKKKRIHKSERRKKLQKSIHTNAHQKGTRIHTHTHLHKHTHVSADQCKNSPTTMEKRHNNPIWWKTTFFSVCSTALLYIFEQKKVN